MIEPFTARTPQADLEDLRQRLATIRWAPEQPAGRDEGAYGFPLRRLRRLVSRWQDFDWRRRGGPAQRLSAVPHGYRRAAGALPFHVRSAVPGALPRWCSATGGRVRSSSTST